MQKATTYRGPPRFYSVDGSGGVGGREVDSDDSRGDTSERKGEGEVENGAGQAGSDWKERVKSIAIR